MSDGSNDRKRPAPYTAGQLKNLLDGLMQRGEFRHDTPLFARMGESLGDIGGVGVHRTAKGDLVGVVLFVTNALPTNKVPG